MKIRYLPLRLRYALIAQIGSAGLFGAAPSHSRRRAANAPEFYHRVVRRLARDDDDTFGLAKRIAHYLSYGHPRGRRLGMHLTAALHAINRGGGGSCSDWAQVYGGLCAAAGIPVREWGLCDSFTAMRVGHAFNEIFSAEYGKWVMVDPFVSMYATLDGTPLGVTELVDYLEAGRGDDIEFHAIDETRRARVAELVALYFKKCGHLFFLTHYNVFEQDRIVRAFGWLPTSLLHSLLLVAGRYQRFWLYTNAVNRSQVEQAVGAVKTLKYVALGQ